MKLLSWLTWEVMGGIIGPMVMLFLYVIIVLYAIVVMTWELAPDSVIGRWLKSTTQRKDVDGVHPERPSGGPGDSDHRPSPG
jgi:hypothetical protein